MKRAVGLALLLVVVGASNASAGAWRIRKIEFAPPGSQYGSPAYINDEIVVIKNTSKKTLNLEGYKLHDKGSKNVYKFPQTKVDAGERVKLHPGKGNDSKGHRFWMLDHYVWNDGSDKATLVRPNGTTADTCAYKSSADSPATC
jgi:hypothetical protein